MFKLRNKNSHLLSGVLALALGASLGACTKESTDNATEKAAATAHTDDQMAAATDEAPAGETAGHADVSEVLTHYEAIRALLVADTPAEIPEHARQLQAAAEKAGAAAPAAAKPHLQVIGKQAQALAALSTDDLAPMRKAFGEVSRPVVAMMTEMPAMAEGYHMFECPMAEGYRRWVQEDATLANPYMGQEMPGCGSEKHWAHAGEGHGHGDEAHGHDDEAHAH